jgi:hypothetical protein
MHRAQLLRQLVLDSQYVVDEHLVAAAIVTRAATRLTLADAGFRNDVRAPRAVRSFRASTHVRSFRPYVLRALLDRRRTSGFAEPR